MTETLIRTPEHTAVPGDLAATMADIGRRARDAAAALALAPAEAKVRALRAAAAAVRSQANEILAANAEDAAEARGAGIGAALIDRLALDPKRLEAVARGLEDIADLPDPIGRVLAEWTRPNGLRISRVSVPLGVIVLNAKMRRVSICGATETLLVDRAVAATMLPPILAELRAAGCELRGDPETLALEPEAVAATEEDWRTEYLDAILAVRIVDGIDQAIEHIDRYGSHHTDAIVTEDEATAERFLREVDSAIVLVNASTQFADGGEFGMGAEIGISTQRLAPRGPVGAAELTTYKYLVRGNGQVRP